MKKDPTRLRRLVLDVLKPHQPDSVAFCRRVAALGTGYRVTLTVTEVDERTETIRLVVEGEDLDFHALQQAIGEMGASLHSVDEVEAVGDHPDGG